MLDRRIRWRPVLLYVAGAMALFAVVAPFDHMLYWHFRPVDTGEADWHRMLRIAGYAPTWVMVAVALALVDSVRIRAEGVFQALSRSFMLLLAVGVAAGLTEPMKILIRRVRPNTSLGEWAWRSWLDEPFRAGGLATPSSHAAIAFAAAFMLCRLHPRATPVWLALALGCGATRVVNHAHYASDIVISAALAFAIVQMLWTQHLRNQATAAIYTPEPAREARALSWRTTPGAA